MMLLVTLTSLSRSSDVPSCKCRSSYLANHTMCQYQPRSCGGQPSLILDNSRLTSEEVFLVLDTHNTLREQIANGSLLASAGMQPAEDMKELVYCAEAERIAQCWVEQCKFEHDFERRLGRFEAGGQNLAIYYYITPEFDFYEHCKYNFPQAITGWFNELYDPGFPPSAVAPFDAVPGTLHFTQMVWASTRYIGCARICHKDSTVPNKYNRLYACVYYNIGNTISYNMYTPGEPNCTAHNMDFSANYPSLCVPREVDEHECPVYEDNFFTLVTENPEYNEVHDEENHATTEYPEN
ncbi:hypothetical protein B566_EDAN002230 [Ephemera danica]|nr:hypothetical protein B566_EDAN002230 [Ephemera danica]